MSRAGFLTLRTGTRSLAVASALLITAVGLTACDDAPTTPEDFLSRAEQSREKGNLRASNIDLKNALQADPQNARARRLLGLNHLDLGAWRTAETTLERAGNDGAQPVLIMRPLARVKLALGKPDQALKIIEIADDMQPGLKAELQVLRGRALVSQRKRDKGREAFDDALKQDKNSYGAYLGLAGLAVADKKNDEADKLFAKAASIAPDNADVLLFQGAYARFKKDHKGAEAAFQKLVKRRPGRIDYRMGLAQTQLATRNHKGAIETLAPVLKASPNYPSANYFRALAAYQAKDYETVVLHTENVLKFDRSNLPTMLIAGAARFALKQYERAASDLERFVSQVPNHEPARKLLGAAQLQLRKPKEALNTLKPVAEKEDADAPLLSLVGTAAVQARKLEDGSGYFDRVVKLQPENARAHAQLGMTQVAMGKTDMGIKQLALAVEKDPDFRRADIALIKNLLRAKRYKEALAAAEQLQRKNPNDASGYSLAGLAQMTLKDEAGAKVSFSKALEIQPGRPDAANNLASFALKEKEIDQAVELLRGVLKIHPGHVQTILRLARIEAGRGNSDEVGLLLEKAVEVRSSAMLPRLLLGRLRLSGSEPQKALAAIEPALRKYPDEPGLLEVAGKAYLAINKFSDAAVMFRRLVEKQPGSAEAHFLLAQAYGGTREAHSVKVSLEAAVKANNKHLRSRIALARLLILGRQFTDAETHLAALKEAQPNSAVVAILDGDLNFAQGNHQKAVSSYELAAKTGRNKTLTMKLSRAYWVAGRNDKGISTLESWLVKKPGDHGLRLQLATYYRESKRLDDARKEYETMIAEIPNNWVPRNELAWLLYSSGDIKTAFAQAKKARELTPRNPLVMDTMALILMARGEMSQAIGLLQQASKSSPRNAEIGYHLAQAYLKDGNREEARRVLAAALSNKGSFAERKAAELLLKELGG